MMRGMMRGMIPALMMLLVASAGLAEDGRIDALVASMTLEEKIGQLGLGAGRGEGRDSAVDEATRKALLEGRLGGLVNVTDPVLIRSLQEATISSSLAKVPPVFGHDVLHGHRTILPVPLAQAAAWDLELVHRGARLAAREARADGIHWTFAPMVDLSCDPRWGRIVEGGGEDPWLVSRLAVAYVQGFQGSDPRRFAGLLALPKHFAGLGAVTGGREYRGVALSRRDLEQRHLRPFRAAIAAGAGGLLTASTCFDGVPCSANEDLLRGVLRRRWAFRGLVVGDYGAVGELEAHGLAMNAVDATLQAFRAGTDLDMAGGTYARWLAPLVEQGQIDVRLVDEALRRVLEAKRLVGLLDDPFAGMLPPSAARGPDDESRRFARHMARRCPVLLRNEGALLPLDEGRLERIAVVGRLAASREDMLGPWSSAGRASDAVSLLDGLAARFATTGPAVVHATEEEAERAVALARESDVVLAVFGEGRNGSGEGTSRAAPVLPPEQETLLRALVATGRPVVLLLVSGRPLVIPWAAERVPAIMQCWFLGLEAGHAMADLLFGDAEPVGRLPLTWPRAVGQIPLRYDEASTGRPVDPGRPDERYASRYADLADGPQWPFGHGLGYGDFAVEAVVPSRSHIPLGGRLGVTARIRNRGPRDGECCAQLYLRDRVGSVVRPVAELKGFVRIRIPAGRVRNVRFDLGPEDWAFLRRDMTWGPEPGLMELRVGLDARDGPRRSFTLLRPSP